MSNLVILLIIVGIVSCVLGIIYLYRVEFTVPYGGEWASSTHLPYEGGFSDEDQN